MNFLKYLSFFFLVFVSSCAPHRQVSFKKQDFYNHVSFLTSDENAGRYLGDKSNGEIIAYIKDKFEKIGIQPIDNSYYQSFETPLFDKPLREYKKEDTKTVNTWNVVGHIEGRDERLKDEYIVLGAHYDHLGVGYTPSSKSKEKGIYHGADDNASGVSALLEIAEQVSINRKHLKRSVIFIAFGAEEQGLIGSKYFVNHPLVPLSKIKLMINMDMVGRLNDQNHIYMGGAGTFPEGVELMKSLEKGSGLTPIVHAGEVGGSDHVSFYKKKISVLGLHTGGHPQYHTTEDTIEHINFEGMDLVSTYIYRALMEISKYSKAMYFIPQDKK